MTAHDSEGTQSFPQPQISEKRWKKEFENDIVKYWKEHKHFAFRQTGKPIYSIDTPPPYVNSPIHIGHATTYTMMDMFARFHRMLGEDVLFPLGLDRNGLPIEIAAEKKREKDGKKPVRLTELSREEAVKACEQILEETSAASTDSFMRLGISFNNYETGENIGDAYLTDSPHYRSLTQATFIDLWERGLIYEDERANNYDPALQTTIADSEIEYEELDSKFNDITFTVKETGEEFIIGTTRPELICACGMIIYNPDDERYAHLEGKTALTPIYGKEVPIRAHPSADKEKGTGIMMMCSFGDVTDIQFFREQKLEPTIAIGRDGKMNENAGFLEGLPVRKARESIIAELEKSGALVKSVAIRHRTPISERSKKPIEFINMKEFYLKQTDQKDKMRELAGQINFYSESSRQILLDWIDTVSIDWPISRRRFYGTEVPLWYGKHLVAMPPRGTYVQPWRAQPSTDATVYDAQSRKKLGTVADFPDTTWEGETRIFDTWFDSSISPLHVLDWTRSDFYERAKPCTLRPQGREIIRTWLYYTLLKDYLLTGERIFKDVWINYYVVDDKGEKMSKSRGNVVDPHEILDKYGAEPFRLWVATEGDITTSNMRCSFDRIDGAGKSLIKLWNASRFVSAFPAPQGDVKLRELDKWILAEIARLCALCRERYSVYDFHEPAKQLKHFLWETFSSHYLELAKARAYNEGNVFSKEEQNGALKTLRDVLNTLLELFAPIIPIITSKIYYELNGKDVHTQQFPSPQAAPVSFSTQDVESFNKAVWKAKQDAQVSLKETVSSATLPRVLEPIAKDLQAAHNIKELALGELSISL